MIVEPKEFLKVCSQYDIPNKAFKQVMLLVTGCPFHVQSSTVLGYGIFIVFDPDTRGITVLQDREYEVACASFLSTDAFKLLKAISD